MKISGIYKIQSITKPERVYIGSAKNMSDRWQHHLTALRRNNHHSIKLQNHFNKYKESDLQFSILLGCKKEDLIKNEQYFIDSYFTYFNICKIAGNSMGRKHSEETRLYLSKIGKGAKHNYPKIRKPITDETREKCRIGNLGKKRSAETCSRISLAKIGLKQPQLLQGWSGRKYSDKTKQLMSESAKKIHAIRKAS